MQAVLRGVGLESRDRRPVRRAPSPGCVGKGVLPALVIVLLTGSTGFAPGWLSQRKAGGSILRGWCVHAAVNILSPIVVFCFLL